MTLQEVRKLKNKMVNEFDVKQIRKIIFALRRHVLDFWPYHVHVNGCGIMNIRGEKCIRVNLVRQLPMGVILPSHFMGVYVVSKVIGKIKKQTT